MLKSICFMFAALFVFPAAAMATAKPDPHFVLACEKNLPAAFASLHAVPYSVKQTAQKDVQAITYNTLHTRNIANLASLGYTMAPSKSDITNEGQVMHDEKSGAYCGSFVSNVDVGYEPVQVFVANIYEPNGCAFNTILAHENEHVEIFRDSVTPEKIAQLEKKLNAGMTKVFYGSTREEVLAQHEAYISGTLSAYFQAVYDKQANFDFHEDYEAMMSSCGGELRNALMDRVKKM